MEQKQWVAHHGDEISIYQNQAEMIADLNRELCLAEVTKLLERIAELESFMVEYDKRFKELSEIATAKRILEAEALLRIHELEAEMSQRDATIIQLKELVAQQAQAMRRADGALQEKTADIQRWKALYVRTSGN